MLLFKSPVTVLGCIITTCCYFGCYLPHIVAIVASCCYSDEIATVSHEVVMVLGVVALDYIFAGSATWLGLASAGAW